MPTQNTGLTSPASIAPGITAITRLSTSSIVAIDSVSAAKTTLRAAKKPRPAFSNGSVDSAYPNRNARPIASAIVTAAESPRAVPIIRPRISPIAQPVRQCSVALAAMAFSAGSRPPLATARSRVLLLISGSSFWFLGYGGLSGLGSARC